MSRRRLSRRERLYRRMRSSFTAFVSMYAEPVSPYINLNLSAPVLTLEEL